MTVATQQTIFDYPSASGTPFAYGCRILDAADLKVSVDDVVQTEGVDYTVSGVGEDTGGSIIFGTALVSRALRIWRSVVLQRTTDYQYAGDFQAPVVNRDFDRLMMALQDLVNGSVESANSLRVPAGEVLTVLPNAATRRGKLIGFADTDDADPVALVTPDAAGATALDLSLRSTASTSAGDAQIGVKRTIANAIAMTLHEMIERSTVCVSDFMTQDEVDDVRAGTQTHDITAAINKALQSTLPFANVVKRKVLLNVEGTYKVTGKLFVRAGCGLIGAGGTATHFAASGMASTDIMIQLGWGLIASVATNDGSGLCPVVEGIFFTGTCTAVSTTGQAGWKCSNLWFACSVGMIGGGADGVADKCIVDTATPVGLVLTGQRNIFTEWHFVNPNYGVQINPPEFANVDGIVFDGCQFFACSFASSYAFATAVIGSITFSDCAFDTSTGVGVRQSTQRHFYTQAGATFENIRFVGCSFNGAKQGDIELLGGVGLLHLIGCDFGRTGIADGAASYVSATSINITTGATVLARGCDFNLIGGQSIRMVHASAKARISDCHSIGCGTGGAGLAASAGEGDKAHFHFEGGCNDIVVADCSTDSTLYVAGASGTSYFHGKNNRSAGPLESYATQTGGTYLGERNGGGTMVPTVASATALTLPWQGGCEVYGISGTTSITSIVATGWEGKTVRLIFTGILTLTDGSNLKLGGNFVTTADDAISLSCMGGNWYETGARAVN